MLTTFKVSDLVEKKPAQVTINEHLRATEHGAFMETMSVKDVRAAASFSYSRRTDDGSAAPARDRFLALVESLSRFIHETKEGR